MENMNTDVRVSRVDFPLPPTPFSLPLHNGNFYLHCQREAVRTSLSTKLNSKLRSAILIIKCSDSFSMSASYLSH